MRISIHEAVKQTAIGGSAAGELFFSKAVIQSTGVPKSEILFLDFQQMELATASFLRTSVLAFRDFCHASSRGLVVTANANDSILEELAMLLTERRDAMPVCKISASNKVTEPKVIGLLDEKQSIAFRGVLNGHRDAASLAKYSIEKEAVGLTAWSNRLAALASKGLIVETAQGRTKSFRPIFEGLLHGN